LTMVVRMMFTPRSARGNSSCCHNCRAVLSAGGRGCRGRRNSDGGLFSCDADAEAAERGRFVLLVLLCVAGVLSPSSSVCAGARVEWCISPIAVQARRNQPWVPWVDSCQVRS
jgi:hypothetical protein